jgi:hypothetical protein
MVAGYTPFTCGGTLANEMEICKNITLPSFTIDFPPDLPTCAKLITHPLQALA